MIHRGTLLQGRKSEAHGVANRLTCGHELYNDRSMCFKFILAGETINLCLAAADSSLLRPAIHQNELGSWIGDVIVSHIAEPHSPPRAFKLNI
jgi:hypothetical protein